ncbi:oxidoreductase [Micromonospora sp. NPDC023888]|uniref:oxidoreductase n=1 Tax=Micromonospora sp. NPDC023888 TaxID=3155607 RepID=UPI003406A341
MQRPQGTPWTVADVPDQTGRVAVVTGASTGLGFEVASVLAARGATLVLACRDRERGMAAARRITEATPGARVSIQQVDLASMASLTQAAEELGTEHEFIDLLINNAGVMVPRRDTTADGHELHLGVNHLGTFALTSLLIDRLLPTPGSRIVTVSSVAHRNARLRLDDLQSTTNFKWGEAYAQSKLANLLFTYELQRRLAAIGAETIAVAAHPGNADTELVRDFPLQQKLIGSPLVRWATTWLFQHPPEGALPLLRAATDPAVQGGEYYGPSGFREYTGSPVRVESIGQSHDLDAQRLLWAASEQLCGVSFGPVIA